MLRALYIIIQIFIIIIITSDLKYCTLRKQEKRMMWYIIMLPINLLNKKGGGALCQVLSMYCVGEKYNRSQLCVCLMHELLK